MMTELGPHRICRSGRHCLALTGVTSDGRCKACRNESHRRNQADYARTRNGRDKRRDTNAAYRGTAKGMLTQMRGHAKERGGG